MFEEPRVPLTPGRVTEMKQEVRALANSIQARFGSALYEGVEWDTVCHYQNGGIEALDETTVEAALASLRAIESAKQWPGSQPSTNRRNT